MSTLDFACATCAAALGITRAEFGRRVGTARKAGWRGLDAVTTAYLAIKDPDWDRRSRAGRKSGDTIESAIWRRSPRRDGDRASRLQSAIRAAGGQWRDGTRPQKPKATLPLVDAALRDAAHVMRAGGKSWDREVRRRIRVALASGPMGFDGTGWGVKS